jgi:hypothetical protein
MGPVSGFGLWGRKFFRREGGTEAEPGQPVAE